VRRVLNVLASPRLLPLHVLALVATCTAVWLGTWQLDAWQQQRDLAARDLSAVAPVPVDRVLSADDAFPGTAVGRPVSLTGRWVPEATFLVSERELAGRTGYWVVTPVAVCDGATDCARSPAILVVRGWTAEPASIAAPEGAVELTGWLQPPEGTGRPDPDRSDDVLPELRIADAIQRVDQDLYGAYVIAEETTPEPAAPGLEPVTPASLPEPSTTTGLRNLLYAVEWWVFAGFALVVWGRWVKDEALPDPG
jgi:cytochrome oxidase assembly protein ShyY1